MARAENDGQRVTAIVKEERWAIKVTHRGQALTTLGRLLGPSGHQANRGGGGAILLPHFYTGFSGKGSRQELQLSYSWDKPVITTLITT
jgi:hypothetical protein